MWMRFWVWAVFTLVFARVASGATNPVVSIRGADTPELKALAARIYGLAEEVYPELVKLTEHRTKRAAPTSFSVEFKRGFGEEKVGTVKGKRILLNAEWISLYPVD